MDDSLCIIFTCSREGERRKNHRYDTHTSDESRREKEKVPTYREEGEGKRRKEG